jgi:hypothetical protein
MFHTEHEPPEMAFEALYTTLKNDAIFWYRFTRFVDGINYIRLGETNPALRREAFDNACQFIIKELHEPNSLFLDFSEEAKAEYALALSKAAQIPIIMVKGEYGFENNGLWLLPFGFESGESGNAGTVVPWIKATQYAEIDNRTFINQQRIIIQPFLKTDLSWVMILSEVARRKIAEITHEAMAFKLIYDLTPAASYADRDSLLAIKNNAAKFQLSSTLVVWDLLISNWLAFETIKPIIPKPLYATQQQLDWVCGLK